MYLVRYSLIKTTCISHTLTLCYLTLTVILMEFVKCPQYTCTWRWSLLRVFFFLGTKDKWIHQHEFNTTKMMNTCKLLKKYELRIFIHIVNLQKFTIHYIYI